MPALSKVTLKVPSGPVRSPEPAKAAGSTGVTVCVPSRTCQVTVSPTATGVTVPLAGVKQGGPQVLSHLAASPVTLMSCPAAPTTTSAHTSPPAAITPTATSTRITDPRTDTCPPKRDRCQPLHYR